MEINKQKWLENFEKLRDELPSKDTEKEQEQDFLEQHEENRKNIINEKMKKHEEYRDSIGKSR